MSRLYVISGEVSGDLHGAKILAKLKELSSGWALRGMGGTQMQNEGVDLIHNISGSSTMGFVDVIRKLGSFKKLLNKVKDDIIDFKPDAVLLIDYGGFNMRIGEFCKKSGIPVHYFILPKVWAWNEGRIKKLKNSVDYGYVIFPFEEEYFSSHGLNVKYVGNPVEEHISNYRLTNTKPQVKKQSVALLPGSRPQEIKRVLPTMLQFAKLKSTMDFIIAAPKELKELFNEYVLPKNVELKYDQMYEVVDSCQAALVTSGTANLEVALLETPLIVVYKADPISYFLAKLFVKIDYISPVNLIARRAMVPELIQGKLNLNQLEKQMGSLMGKGALRQASENSDELKRILGSHMYSLNVAKKIIQQLKNSNK